MLNIGNKVVCRGKASFGTYKFFGTYKLYGTITEHVANTHFGLLERVLLEEDWMGIKEIWTYPHKISKISTLCA